MNLMWHSSLKPWLLFVAIGFGIACQKTVEHKERPIVQSHVDRTDVEGLEKLINLPAKPKQVRWQTTAAGKGGNWSLSALLWLTPEEAANVASSSEPLMGESGRMLSRHARWLPPSLTEGKAVPADDDAVVEMKGKPIEPTAFTNAQKSGLLNGDALVFPDEGLVYVSLYTM